MNTSYFTIDEGSTAGVYCAHCGEKIKPEGEGVGEFIYQCTCQKAQDELALLKEREKADTNYTEFMEVNNADMQRQELLGKLKYHETAAYEIREALDFYDPVTDLPPHSPDPRIPPLSTQMQNLLNEHGEHEVREALKGVWDKLWH